MGVIALAGLFVAHLTLLSELCSPHQQGAGFLNTDIANREVAQLVAKLYEQASNADESARIAKARDRLIAIARRSAADRKRVVTALLPVLDDTEAWRGVFPGTWHDAAWILSDLKATEAIPVMTKYIGRPLSSVAYSNGIPQVALLISKFGEPAVPELTKALRAEDAYVRADAAWALGKIGGIDALEALQDAQKNESNVFAAGRIRSAIFDATRSRKRSKR